MIDGKIRLLINRGQFKLVRSHLVVTGFARNAKFKSHNFQFAHKSSHTLGNATEIMVFHLLVFSGIVPHQCATRQQKVGTSGVETFVRSVDHWIAFILLAFIGGKMIVEAIKNEEEDVRGDPFRFGNVLVLAIATSIDALATGFVFSSFGFTTGRLILSVLLIGAITFALSLFGVLAGKKLGDRFKRWAVLAGGVALVGIGLKILIEHLIG